MTNVTRIPIPPLYKNQPTKPSSRPMIQSKLNRANSGIKIDTIMEKPHFLVVAYPTQSHINPALQLAKRLVRSTGAAVTFSTAVSAFRRIFPSSVTNPDDEIHDGLLSYLPFSDGYDDGFRIGVDSMAAFMSNSKLAAYKSLSSVIESLTARGRRVTCVIYTILLTWAGDVAFDHGIPSAQYWIQPATVFALYYYYFHGYQGLVSDHGNEPHFTIDFPGMPPLRIKDLPSFVINMEPENPYYIIFQSFRDLFEKFDMQAREGAKPKILVNTFEESESEALKAAADTVELVAIGPILHPDEDLNEKGANMHKEDEKGYMEWLDTKPEGSVVYVSFGSISVLKKEQVEEISRGLKESGRPYLWVVRKDSRWEGVELEVEGEDGMVVEWCSQVRVLNHPSVGCFVTHCGWNSTVESLVYGVPTVGVPQWADQGTNASLMERQWGTGVRVEVNEEGLVEGGELRRCLELVMGEGERGLDIRRKARIWREKARQAIGEGGSSDRNFMAFVEDTTSLEA